MEFGPQPASVRPDGRPFGSEWIGDELRPLTISSQAHLGLATCDSESAEFGLMMSDRLALGSPSSSSSAFVLFVLSIAPSYRPNGS